MNLGLVFSHGWGLDAHFWQALAARLAQHHPQVPQYPQVFLDAGYFGVPKTPPLPPGHRWVGIGHSLGFARLLQAPPAAGWAGLVSVAGFTRFCAPVSSGAGGGEGQPRRVVERMLRALAREPRGVLADFLERCGLSTLMPKPDAVLDAARLAADLALLLDIDVSHQLAGLAASNVPVLALAAHDDAIVSSALTTATFAQHANTRLVWQAQGGHALGYVGVEECAVAIAEFLGNL